MAGDAHAHDTHATSDAVGLTGLAVLLPLIVTTLIVVLAIVLDS
jgi:hypothetical protein